MLLTPNECPDLTDSLVYVSTDHTFPKFETKFTLRQILFIIKRKLKVYKDLWDSYPMLSKHPEDDGNKGTL